MTRLRPKSGDVVVERYLLLDRMTDAGVGTAFRAVHLATERTVVLQYLVPSTEAMNLSMRGGGEEVSWRVLGSHEVSSLVNRVRLLARLDHPALLPIQDADVDEVWPFVVRSLVSGQSLAARLRASRPAPRELITWMLMISSGLKAARDVGVVHRDLRPDNILLACSTREAAVTPYLVDFGLAHLNDVVDAQDLLSPLRGPYRAPERLQPNHGYKEPGDVYALSAMLHEGLTGRLAKPMTRLRAGLADWPPNVPPELAELVTRCLSVQPRRRLGTLSEWSAALSALVIRGGSLAPAPAKESRLPAPVTGPSVAVEGGALHDAETSADAVARRRERLTRRSTQDGGDLTRRVKRERRVIQAVRRTVAPVTVGRLSDELDGPLHHDGGPPREAEAVATNAVVGETVHVPQAKPLEAKPLEAKPLEAKPLEAMTPEEASAKENASQETSTEKASASEKAAKKSPAKEKASKKTASKKTASKKTAAKKMSPTTTAIVAKDASTAPESAVHTSLVPVQTRTSAVGALGVLGGGGRLRPGRLPSPWTIGVSVVAALGLLLAVYAVALRCDQGNGTIPHPTLVAP